MASPYARTAEDAADRSAVQAWLTERERGDSDDVPLEMVQKLLDPKNSRVRVWREHRGMTASALASEAGLSAAYVSQIERGQRDPGLKALKSIAAVLKVDLDDLA